MKCPRYTGQTGEETFHNRIPAFLDLRSQFKGRDDGLIFSVFHLFNANLENRTNVCYNIDRVTLDGKAVSE